MSFSMRNKLRTKSFIVTTIIIAVVLSIVVNLPWIISQFSKDDGPDRIGFVENDAPAVTERLQAYYASQEKPGIELVGYPDAGSAEANEEAMKERIRSKEIQGYLDFDTEGSAFPAVIYKSEKMLDTGKTNSLSGALQAIKADIILSGANLTDEQRAALAQPVKIEPVQITTAEGTGSIGDGKTVEEQALAFGLVYALIIVLFMGIMITGQLIATEITAEKSSRVMEILVTSVAPLTQMFGKIIAMFLVGLLQIGFYIAVVILNIMLPHNQEMLSSLDINLASIDPMLVVYAVIFYLTGYFLYATLYAAVGSIVSRTEELGQAVMPLTMLSIAAFYIGIFGIQQPHASFVEVASFIPFFAPFVMFMRIGLTDPALWEVLLSLGILLATILVLGWLSAKIYRTGVLMYGKRPTIKELVKAMKAYKV